MCHYSNRTTPPIIPGKKRPKCFVSINVQMGLNVDPIEEEVVVYGLHPDCCRPRRGPEEHHLFFFPDSRILRFSRHAQATRVYKLSHLCPIDVRVSPSPSPNPNPSPSPSPKVQVRPGQSSPVPDRSGHLVGWRNGWPSQGPFLSNSITDDETHYTRCRDDLASVRHPQPVRARVLGY